jgi:hypothetical protein
VDHRQELSGLSALGAAATVVIGIGMYATLFSDLTTGDPDPGESVAFIADNYTALYVWNLIVMIAFGVLLVPLALAIYERLKVGSNALAQTATAFGLIWACLLIGAGPSAPIPDFWMRDGRPMECERMLVRGLFACL